MDMNDLKDKKATVLGLGVNQGGLGAARWLAKHGAKVTVTDLQDAAALAEPVAELEKLRVRHPVRFVLGRHDEKDMTSADLVIKNPAVPNDSPFLRAARRAGVPVETDVSIFFRLCPFPVIGVTGSKGKTTVTLMLGSVLRKAFGRAVVAGNLGRSPLDDLDGLLARRAPVPVVLELSSWGLESLSVVKKSPHVAVLTNLFREHLNRYKDFAEYAAAKENIFRWQGKGDIAILPNDAPTTRKMGARVRGERFWVSDRPLPREENGLFFRGSSAMLRRQGEAAELFVKHDLRVLGEHAVRDALFAAGAAFLAGAAPEDIRAALREFRGAPHRLEPVRTSKGVGWWNDSAATHPEASIAGMEAVARARRGRGRRRVILIAGGADKNLEFGAWAGAARRLAKAVILLDGTATPKMARALRRKGLSPHAVVRSMEEAVFRARLLAVAGDEVLLSPGAASFGLFRNEFDRGDRFRRAVRKGR